MSAPAEQPKIVVIDDDYAMRLSCQKILTKTGFAVETYEDGARGLEAVALNRPALVIVDLKMPGLSGMEVIERVHEIDASIVIVVITGYATIDTAVEAMKAGAYDFLPKPFSPDELRLIVNRGLERRRLTLEARRGELERELLRRRFVTFVSHQLQTPLVAIHQYLNVLKRLEDAPDAAARRREWFDRCLKRIEEMQGLIRNWLTLSAIEGRCLARERVKVDVCQLIRAILETYREMAAAEQVSIEACLAEPCFARGDRDCLNVLFDNLIVNAIKYNRPGGRVTVSAGLDGGEVAVVVSDTGVGIPEQYRQFLFDEFFRIKSGDGGKKTAGSGLGLSICKRIVSELGGRIDVESQVGVGSTFRVRLPAWRETDVEQAETPAQQEA